MAPVRAGSTGQEYWQPQRQLWQSADPKLACLADDRRLLAATLGADPLVWQANDTGEVRMFSRGLHHAREVATAGQPGGVVEKHTIFPEGLAFRRSGVLDSDSTRIGRPAEKRVPHPPAALIFLWAPLRRGCDARQTYYPRGT
jgi:hypothetical protein